MIVDVFEVNQSHLERLQRIAQETFYRTFIHETTEQNMQAYLAEVFSIEQLQQQLLNTDIQLFLAVADEDVGYLKLNTGTSQTELREEEGIEIERLYVKQPFHGKGVADALMQQAIKTGVALKKSYIWLGVAETNVKAVKFYSKYGFEVFGQHAFLLGGEKQTDLMMKRDLP
jgi:ribosomal protein S18 acetylase RimI-like enzyme